MRVRTWISSSFRGVKTRRAGRGDPARRRVGLLQRVDAGAADLRVLRRGPARHADGADDLAVDDDRDPALERARAGEPEDSQVAAALGQGVIEGLARSAEGDGRIRLLARDL